MVWSEGGGEDDPIRQEVKARERYTRRNNSKIKQENMIKNMEKMEGGKGWRHTETLKIKTGIKTQHIPKKSRTMTFINRWVSYR